MSGKLRIGIAGGTFGARHLEAFSRLDDVEVTALADPDEAIRRELSNTHEIPNQFDTAEELIEANTVDAIVIATPTRLHERHVCAAIDADLHVLCENPPASSESEMSRISSNAGFSGKIYMWAREQRFAPEIQKGRQLFEAGELGKVYHATARWQHRFWPFENDDWRRSRDEKGGALLNMGIHIIDSVWYAMGCPDPVEALSSAHNHFLSDRATDPTDAAEDSSFGMIRFKNGSTISFETAYFSHFDERLNEEDSSIDLKLWGTEASLDLVNARKSSTDTQSESYAAAIEENDLFAAQAREFVDAIKEDREPQNSRKQAQSLMKMLDALAQSAKDQKAVSIRTIRDLDDLFGGV